MKFFAGLGSLIFGAVMYVGPPTFTEVVDDTTPSLGGNLDLAGFDITETVNSNFYWDAGDGWFRTGEANTITSCAWDTTSNDYAWCGNENAIVGGYANNIYGGGSVAVVGSEYIVVGNSGDGDLSNFDSGNFATFIGGSYNTTVDGAGDYGAAGMLGLNNSTIGLVNRSFIGGVHSADIANIDYSFIGGIVSVSPSDKHQLDDATNNIEQSVILGLYGYGWDVFPVGMSNSSSTTMLALNNIATSSGGTYTINPTNRGAYIFNKGTGYAVMGGTDTYAVNNTLGRGAIIGSGVTAIGNTLQGSGTGIITLTGSASSYAMGNRVTGSSNVSRTLNLSTGAVLMGLNYNFTGNGTTNYLGESFTAAGAGEGGAGSKAIALGSGCSATGTGSLCIKDSDGTQTNSTVDSAVFDFDNGVTFVGGDVTFPSYTREMKILPGEALKGSSAPDDVTTGAARCYGFDGATINEVAHFAFIVPSDWDGASDMTLHAHWHPASGSAMADTETVKFDLNYYSIAAGEAVDNGTVATATATYTQSGAGTDKELIETAITLDYDGANQPLAAGDHVFVQFTRDQSTDTYGSDAVVCDWGIEYTSTKLPAT